MELLAPAPQRQRQRVSAVAVGVGVVPAGGALVPTGVVAASVVVGSSAARAHALAQLPVLAGSVAHSGGKRKAAQDREDEMLREYYVLESRGGGRVDELRNRYGLQPRAFSQQIGRAKQRCADRELAGTSHAALKRLELPVVQFQPLLSFLCAVTEAVGLNDVDGLLAQFPEASPTLQWMPSVVLGDGATLTAPCLRCEELAGRAGCVAPELAVGHCSRALPMDNLPEDGQAWA